MQIIMQGMFASIKSQSINSYWQLKLAVASTRWSVTLAGRFEFESGLQHFLIMMIAYLGFHE